MIRMFSTRFGRASLAAALLAALGSAGAHADITGVTGTTFDFAAKVDYILGGDGQSIHLWGYANGGGRAQYPGPTLIVNQGDTITINLTNYLPEATSIVFPGMDNVTATATVGVGSAGALTLEAPPDAGTTTITYTFTASNPGTFEYYSGTRVDLQVEMGLMGAIIVRPAGYNPASPTAYGSSDTRYDVEFLFVVSEMDLSIHRQVERGRPVDTTEWSPVYWFLNGRNFPDTIMPNNVPWAPTQPYNCLPIMQVGQRLLLRMIGGGRDGHPMHPHGNNVTIIAQDGQVLDTGAVDPPMDFPDLAFSDYTLNTFPGQTVDSIFEWTGKGMGWDIYGHALLDPTVPGEYLPDHGKEFPVVLPELQALTLGAAYSGSPFLGQSGQIPPGQGGLNPFDAYFFPWHSHHEKEIVNNDIFIGGMLTFVVILPL